MSEKVEIRAGLCEVVSEMTKPDIPQFVLQTFCSKLNSGQSSIEYRYQPVGEPDRHDGLTQVDLEAEPLLELNLRCLSLASLIDSYKSVSVSVYYLLIQLNLKRRNGRT